MISRSVSHPLRLTLLIVASITAACSDSVTPSPAGPVVSGIPLSPALVSAPVEPSAPPSAASGSSGTGTAYVSMLSGTESDAVSVAVTNSEDGATVVAELDEGGFDPIGIRAQADDSLLIAITGPDGVSLAYAKVPRRSRPVVVRTTPGNRRTDVVLNPVIHVVFNEPMDITSLRDAVRLRRDGTIVPGTVSVAGVDDDHLTAIFVPAAPLEPNATYELQVTADARSRAGAALAEPIAVAFTTGSTTAPATSIGTVIVKTVTTGTGPYLNGYWTKIGSGFVQNIGINASITTAGIPVGSVQVELGGLGTQCVLDGAPVRTASVGAGTTVTLTFQVVCGSPGPSPTTGTLVVTTLTQGLEVDPDGYTVSIAGVAHPIGMNATITAQVSSDPNVVTLSGLSGNCTQAGTGSTTVTVPAGTSLSILLVVRCGPEVPGSLVVTTSTVGPDPGGTPYVVTLDAVATWPIAANATITIPNVAPGPHRLTLSGVSGNCVISGKTPPSPMSPPTDLESHWTNLADGSSAEFRWDIRCQPPVGTSLTIITATTGVEIDPDGYEFHLAGVTTKRIGVDGRMTLASLAAGLYELELRELSANCALAGLDPKRRVSVVPGAQNTVTFAVNCTPDFQPSGVLAFTRQLGSGRSAIFTANADGSGVTQVTDGSGRDFDPSWSPNATQLAFIRERDQGAASLYTVNADGSGLVERYAGALSNSPSWSPDGRRIAISTYRQDGIGGETGVYVVNLDDGTISARIGPPRGASTSPDWSPDGGRIAITSDWNAFDISFDVFVMAADGTGLRDAIYDSWADLPTQWYYFSPDWSPDGNKLLVSVCNSGYYVCWPDRWIAVANGDGSALTRIAYDGAVGAPLDWVDPDAVWSPDASTIAYHSTVCRGARRCIRYVRSGGGGSSVTLEDAHDPAWKP